MRKNKLMSKVGAVALSAAMVAGSLVVAPVSEVNAAPQSIENLACTGFWTNHAAGVEIEDGGEYTFTFDAQYNAEYDAATTTEGDVVQQNWDGPILVFFSGDGVVNGEGYSEHWVTRADNYGWAGNSGATGSTVDTGNSDFTEGNGWTKLCEDLAAGTECTVTVNRTGNTVEAVMNLSCIEGKTTFTLPEDFSSDVYLSLSGQCCDLTNITWEAPAIVDITASNNFVAIDGTLQLSAAVVPSNNTDELTEIVSWESSDEDVATVDENGLVTSVALGEVVITAKASEDVYSTIELEVVDALKPLESIAVSADKTEIKIGQTATLTTTFTPADTTDDVSGLTYESSDEKVATVKDGVVTAVGVGTATITATCGNFTATVNITVPKVPATSLTATLDGKTELKLGESATIKTTVAPSDTTDAIEFKSMNSAVVVVDSTGKVSAVGPGTTKVKVVAGSLTKEFTFTVSDTEEIDMGNLSCDGWWTAHTAGVKIEANKTYTFTFNAKSTDKTNAWHGPVYVAYTNSEAKVDNASSAYKEYMVCRGDNWGWTSAGDTGAGTLGTGYTFTTNSLPESDDWVATYKDTLFAGSACTMTAKLSGKNLIVTYNVAGVSTTTTIPVDTSKPVYLSLTGEKCNLTNIVCKVKTLTSTVVPTAVTGDEVEKINKAGITVTGAPTGAKIVADVINSDSQKKVEALKDTTLKGLTFQAIELNLMNGDKQITDKGEYKVTMPIIASLAKASKVKVFVLEGDKLTLVADSVAVVDGKITFTAPHFSTYVFAADMAADATADTAPIVPVVIVGCIAAAGLIVSKKRRVTE